MNGVSKPNIELVLATENEHKLLEFREILGGDFKILSLKDISFREKFPEEGDRSYEENAIQKARFLSEHTGRISLGDDSGFEVEALGGEPGIRSARFMGTHHSPLQRGEILKRLQNASNRRARFVCYLAYSNPQKREVKTFFGEVRGVIALEERGEHGFGYDPIFVPDGYEKTLAELDPSVKNKISHRARATFALRDFLIAL